ncbi:Aspartate/methionine/tyrosine aminotransferase [Shimia gijangensis]|uniref:aspartate transaminase n=1 Tax=Shimia gijangensis TaxID=1470563 RepID=A0A1M6EU51_9RHOB|nr:aminotransferase [Shimia gijangensis]SHI88890.1 Aspartate/methionine/tyrosine aminotransferase [Shimia gijangensis]
MSLPRTATTFAPPVMEAYRWRQGVEFTDEHPLINVSQAAPVDPPPEALRQHIAEVALHVPEAHLYGPVFGMSELRAEVAAQFSAAYGGKISDTQVAITSGCNQAFCAAMMSLAGEGDEVILPTPWYFNHKMWLDMQGIKTVALSTGADLLPDPEIAEALITEKTRAVVLVTPNNPGGVEYSAELVRAFADLAARRDLQLIVDETYRDFDSRTGAPHALFENPDWADHLIQLYSFSKAYRLTGHRVGAMIASEARLSEVEKFLDTVTICPNQLGQHAALWGMRNLGQWLAGERAEILDRRAAITDHMPLIADQGWQVMGVGAYFAYLRHPFDMASDDLARALVQKAHVLTLPGTMFNPENSQEGRQQMRIAFANVDRQGIEALFHRLKSFEI